MLNKLTLAATLLVAGFAHKASAAPQWVNSNPIQNAAYCGGATATQIGYLTDTVTGLHTGDISYIHIVAQAGCAYDTVGFDLFLPAGVATAISTQNPVYCFRDGVALTSTYGGCSQTASTGNYGGLFYGWSNLNPGDYFELQVPVYWGKASPGQVEAVLSSAMSPLTPVISPTIGYSPAFKNFVGVSSFDGTFADVAFELDHFFVTSQVVVEYGNGVFDHATPPVTASASAQYYPNVSAQLPGTTPGTLLSWRIKLTNAYGTFYSSTQTLGLHTSGIILPPPLCKRIKCL